MLNRITLHTGTCRTRCILLSCTPHTRHSVMYECQVSEELL